MAIKDGGKYLSTDVVIAVLTIIASVVVTFFATRASLENRIEKLEEKLPIADYLTTRAITRNVNDLSYMRTQIVELGTQVNAIAIPTLQFQKGVPPELGAFPATPWQLNQEWVSNLADAPSALKPLEIDKLSKLLDGDAASTLRSEDAFLRLQAFVQLAYEYDRALGELVYVYGAPTTQNYVAYPTLHRGASRQSAQEFLTRATELIPRMKQSIAGIQPLVDDEIHEARALLDRNK